MEDAVFGVDIESYCSRRAVHEKFKLTMDDIQALKSIQRSWFKESGQG